MAPPTPRLIIPIDLKKKPWEQKLPLHNRWHPEIPPVTKIKTGEMFRIEMVDWTAGAIQDNNSAIDVKTIDLSTVSMHKLITQHPVNLTNKKSPKSRNGPPLSK